MTRRFTVITLFPELVGLFARTGIVGRACERGLVSIDTINPRDHATDQRRTVDDSPYGGGPGMVMMVEPMRAAIAAARAASSNCRVLALGPQGRRFDQAAATELAASEHLVLVAGRYEGLDERLLQHDVDAEWSLGDFVVSGGEVPAMMLAEAVIRLVPGALGHAGSAAIDSFCDSLLDHPHYTRPEVVDGQSVPPVLLSGNHAEIARWRRRERLRRTYERRPDLLRDAVLSDEDRAQLKELLGRDYDPTRD